MKKHFEVFFLAVCAVLLSFSSVWGEEPASRFSSRMIWNGAKHCAFTDIIQFKGKFYCTFRESSVGHIPGKKTGEGDGVVRVLCSTDGDTFKSHGL